MTAAERFVPKVHPTTREIEAEDPMELVATPLVGDPNVMLDCVVQEFAWMGWDEEQLMGLFFSPGYPVLIQLLDSFGKVEVRRRLRDILARQGSFRVRETIAQGPDSEDQFEPELIQIAVRKRH